MSDTKSADMRARTLPRVAHHDEDDSVASDSDCSFGSSQQPGGSEGPPSDLSRYAAFSDSDLDSDLTSTTATPPPSQPRQRKRDFFIRDGRMVGIKVKRSEVVRVQRGRFSGVRTVHFPYLACCKQEEDDENSQEAWAEQKGRRIRFRVSGRVWEYNCIKNAFLNAGFFRSNGRTWNVLWGKHLTIDQLSELHPAQRANHFPGTSALGRKDRLATLMSQAQRRHGREMYNFAPTTYILPDDYSLLHNAMSSHRVASTAYRKRVRDVWLVKPYSSSCGRGIRLISEAHQVDQHAKVVAQKYLANPFLIRGRKFDLRLYVVVTSFDPLIVYMHPEGLVRFATKKYNLQPRSLRDRQMHLTNYSVQKKFHEFAANQDDGNGKLANKWSLSELCQYLRDKHAVDMDGVMSDIHDVVVKTIISCQHDVVSRLQQAGCLWNQCFELYGFDVILDNNLKPWLLEVNLLPSLSASSPLDKRIKTTLMCDLFHCVGVPSVDIKRDGSASSSELQSPRGALPMRHAGSDRSTMLVEDAHRTMLQEIVDQFGRRRNFQLIFPTPARVTKFHTLFDYSTARHRLLWSFLALPADKQAAVLSAKQPHRMPLQELKGSPPRGPAKGIRTKGTKHRGKPKGKPQPKRRASQPRPRLPRRPVGTASSTASTSASSSSFASPRFGLHAARALEQRVRPRAFYPVSNVQLDKRIRNVSLRPPSAPAHRGPRRKRSVRTRGRHGLTQLIRNS